MTAAPGWLCGGTSTASCSFGCGSGQVRVVHGGKCVVLPACLISHSLINSRYSARAPSLSRFLTVSLVFALCSCCSFSFSVILSHAHAHLIHLFNSLSHMHTFFPFYSLKCTRTLSCFYLLTRRNRVFFLPFCSLLLQTTSRFLAYSLVSP